MFFDNLEGWDGQGGGRCKREETYVYLWLIHVDVWKKPTQYCKAIILQLKNKLKKKYEVVHTIQCAQTSSTYLDIQTLKCAISEIKT